jgi:hypothetical protein
MAQNHPLAKPRLPKVLALVSAGSGLLASSCDNHDNTPDGGYCADPQCIVIQDTDGGPRRLPDGGYDCECPV